MAVYNKFDITMFDLGNKVHHLANDVLKVYASNTAPAGATHQVKADVAEITAQNGYPAGGSSIANTWTRAGGTSSLGGTDVTWTATGGSFGPLRYILNYNDTPTAPADPLISWWDNAASVTVNDGETFTVDFGANIFQLA